jgi:predicted RNA-binding Zn-ribbon protein involved in translation (DUF1610 family)
MRMTAFCDSCKREVSVLLSNAMLVIPTLPLAPKVQFSCPECGSERSVTTSDEIADTLIQAGVVAERVDVVVPSQLAEPHGRALPVPMQTRL